jgi:hypothetical protein
MNVECIGFDIQEVKDSNLYSVSPILLALKSLEIIVGVRWPLEPR